MGGEYGPQLAPIGGFDHFLGAESIVDEAGDGFVESVVSGGFGLGEIIDAVNLLGGVGQVEVGRERPHELDRINELDPGEGISQELIGFVILAEFAGERANLLDPVEKLRPVLSDQSIAELAAEPTNIASQNRVEVVE